jgi:hypothetical protein
LKVPRAVGVPLIVITFDAQAAVTPAGRFTGAPIPVAIVVACVMLVSAVLTQSVGVDDAGPAVADVTTVTGTCLVLLVPQLFTATTWMVPEVAVAEKSTVTEFVVPWKVAPVPPRT